MMSDAAATVDLTSSVSLEMIADPNNSANTLLVTPNCVRHLSYVHHFGAVMYAQNVCSLFDGSATRRSGTIDAVFRFWTPTYLADKPFARRTHLNEYAH